MAAKRVKPMKQRRIDPWEGESRGKMPPKSTPEKPRKPAVADPWFKRKKAPK